MPPSRLPLRAHFHLERETSGYEAGRVTYGAGPLSTTVASLFFGGREATTGNASGASQAISKITVHEIFSVSFLFPPFCKCQHLFLI